MKITKDAIIKFFGDKQDAVHEFRDIMRAFGVSKAARLQLKNLVDDLVDEGKLLKQKGNRYRKAGDTARITGKLATHRDGYGFVTPDGGGEDIFIPARFLRENMHGDRVEVRIAAQGRSGKSEGRIGSTLERAHARIVGKFRKTRNFGYVIPDEQRITRDLYIPPGATGLAEDGQVVVAEITVYPTDTRSAEGRLIDVLGWPDDPGVEAETVIRKYNLPRSFPSEVMAEALSVAQTVPEEEIAKRIDLREYPTVTIDGETARDFDDAVSVHMEQEGQIRLRVSIADVSHYVKASSPVDAEAYERGTSVYFPDRCIPMLPEQLSNGICSLNPDVDRLTVTADMVFDQAGEPLQTRFYPSVIRSCARLTYTNVRKILVDNDPDLLKSYSTLVPHLQMMQRLASTLTEKRRKRGSIDFDLPEPEIIIDLQGQTEAIVRAERNVAHQMIEEFMLAANESVAAFLTNKAVPTLYRIHESPAIGKLQDFSEFIRNFGYDFTIETDRISPRQFQDLLAAAKGKPEEKLINGMLLRCMKQARYSDENEGHFGLAASCYTHFTSPIRRYPDLVVHRTLKAALVSESKKQNLARTLPETAEHSSSRERLAMEAEREIILLKKIQFMRDKLGQDFEGFITGVSAYGFYVELVDLFVEGMVHVSMLPQDFYRYVEKQHTLLGEHTRVAFRIGDKVRVTLASVSTEKKQIDFVLAESGVKTAPVVSSMEEYPKLPVTGKSLKTIRKNRKSHKGLSDRGKRR